MSKLIPLTQGQFAIVDDEDYEQLSQWKWCVRTSGKSMYATRAGGILMHRVILETPKGMDTDHINHDTLDNRRINLRICSRQQNHRNKRSKPNSTSRYKGVSWDKRKNKWQVLIRINGRNKKLGYFTSEIEAGRAYDAAARIHHGEFIYPNFPDD